MMGCLEEGQKVGKGGLGEFAWKNRRKKENISSAGQYAFLALPLAWSECAGLSPQGTISSSFPE